MDLQKRKELFYSKIDKTDSCWNWTGQKTKQGYGNFRYIDENNDIWFAHRFAMFLEGRLTSDLVLHSCHNPSCVNPDHLHMGTHAENMMDMSIQKTHGTPRKISDSDVAYIRKSSKSLPILANMFNVSTTVVWKIKHRHTYKDLP